MQNLPIITVTGTTNSGKSTIAHLIKTVLEDHGIEVKINDVEDFKPTNSQVKMAASHMGMIQNEEQTVSPLVINIKQELRYR